jgi:hypothetical protein
LLLWFPLWPAACAAGHNGLFNPAECEIVQMG